MAQVTQHVIDTARGVEVVTITDDFGHRHLITLHTEASDPCPQCGRTVETDATGQIDFDATIEQARLQIEGRADRMKVADQA
jgi:hypothetical protein